MSKPQRADQYAPLQIQAVRAVCSELASALGDLSDELVVVGGLVPSLLIDAGRTGGETHVGTMDLDIGLNIGLPNHAHYARLAARLRGSGFAPATGKGAELSPHRWMRKPDGPSVDFLIAPQQPKAAAGDLVRVDEGLDAVVTPGLRLAFRDRVLVRVSRGPRGDRGPNPVIGVCGPGAFVVLKALAFRGRHEDKDAYDAHYVIRHYGNAVEDVPARLRPLLDDWDAQRAIEYLRADFAEIDSPGPLAVARFVARPDDEGFRADVAGAVRGLLDGL